MPAYDFDTLLRDLFIRIIDEYEKNHVKQMEFDTKVILS